MAGFVEVNVTGTQETINHILEMASRHPSGRVIVYNEVPYAPYVEYGTMAHEIVPVNKSVLAFPLSGGDAIRDRETGWIKGTRFSFGGKTTRVSAFVMTKHVFHPGTAPRPFMRPALLQNATFIHDTINEIMAGRMDVTEGLNVIGTQVSETAKDLCPWKTGNLRRFILFDVEAGGET